MNLIDPAKPNIEIYQTPQSRMLRMEIEPKHTGIIKLATDGQPFPSPQPEPTPPKVLLILLKRVLKKWI